MIEKSSLFFAPNLKIFSTELSTIILLYE